MVKKIMDISLFALFCLAVAVPNVQAEEPKYELKTTAATVRDVLAEQAGKRVIVRLESGENLEGTVTKVGDSVVHLAKLSGRDFYDAVVRIDRISAVLFRVRSN